MSSARLFHRASSNLVKLPMKKPQYALGRSYLHLQYAKGGKAGSTLVMPRTSLATQHSFQASQMSGVSTRFSHRQYATISNQHGPSDAEPTDKPVWIDVLESVADGPWVENMSPDEKMRLYISHGLGCQLLLYLSRPIGDKKMLEAEPQSAEDAHVQYLSAFATAPVPDHSEIGRARIAAAKLIKAVIKLTNSLPSSSPIRSDPENGGFFQTAEALQSIGDAYLINASGKVEDWGEFWNHSQPILIGLVEALADRGFMLKESDFKEGEGQDA